jgi:hypothetical protein
MVASKLEHGRPCCNILDALACSTLATWCPSWGKSPWLATTTTPHSSLPYHWLCFYLSTMYPFLACSCSPARPAIHSPQSVLLLLSCSSPSLHLWSLVLEKVHIIVQFIGLSFEILLVWVPGGPSITSWQWWVWVHCFLHPRRFFLYIH